MAIFPIEQESVQVVETPQDRGVNHLFDFELNDFILKDGKLIELYEDAAVVFWIEKTLRTEFEQGAVYENTEYGMKLNEIKGKVLPLEVAKTIFETNIKSALLQHPRVNAIENFTLEQIEDKVNVTFEVDLTPISALSESVLTSESGFTRITTLEEIKAFIGIKLLTSNRFLFKTSVGTQVYVG